MQKLSLINSTFLQRLGVAVIFLSHSLHGIFTNNDVKDFGNLFLNKIGFAPFGVLLAWIVVLSQIVTSILFLFNKFTNIACVVNILILLVGIITVHFSEGWYVVGAGRNGMEFSFILIVVLFTILLQNEKEKRTMPK